MPTVSVIIPTYNRVAYVQEAIDSVLAQTYVDFEILVIDDGSTDGTRDALRHSYASRIRYIGQKNSGRSTARNTGIMASTGQYISFLDDDDRYLPTKLAQQVAFMEKRPDVSVVASGVYLTDSTGKVIGSWEPWVELPALDIQSCIKRCPLATCGVLIRRDALDLMQPWFDPELGPAEDTDFFLRLLLAGARIVWLDKVVAEYRQHATSSQHDTSTYAVSYRRVLDRVLADPRLPMSVRDSEATVKAANALYWAGRCYAGEAWESGSQWLAEALSLRPIYRTSEARVVLDALARGSQRFGVGDPFGCLKSGVELAAHEVELPSRDTRLALARAAQRGFYNAWSCAEYRGVFRNFLRSAIRQPSWLANRGTWSIFLRSLWRSIGLSNGTKRPGEPE